MNLNTAAHTGALALLALALAFAPSATATHVTPSFIEGPDNQGCSDFADGADWTELKVDPPADGTYVSADGTFSVDVTFADGKLDWTATAAVVVAAFVKDGDAGHYLYEYDPAEDADTGLTTPGGGEDQISHVSFCYVPALDCEDMPEMPECQPTCEDMPEMPECQPNCEDMPEMPECQPNCEDMPDMPECQPDCSETPDLPECQPTCEDMPDMPECLECPATITALALTDGAIRVTVTTEAEFDLYRTEGDGAPVHLGHFMGLTVYEDPGLDLGTTYTYSVVIGDETCDEVEVTAIPDFPMAIGVLAATALGVAGYAVMRRKD